MAITSERQLAQLHAEADQLSTELGNGSLCWHRWPGPRDSRPLLLLHGGFGSWTHWVANIRELRKTRTLWVVDMPGLGASADMSEPHTAEHFSALILSSLNALHGVEAQFDIAGFSFGALIGAYLAASVRFRCHHFVACGAAGFGDLHVQVDLQRPPDASATAEEAASIHYSNLRTLMFSHSATIDDRAVYVHGQNLACSRFNSRSLARGDGFLLAMAGITAKLCGIWGSEDATAGGRAAIEQREALFRQYQPDCSFHILEGIGHWAMYEDAASFNRIIQQELGS